MRGLAASEGIAQGPELCLQGSSLSLEHVDSVLL